MPLAEVTGDIGVVAMYLGGAIFLAVLVGAPHWRVASIARSRAREKEAEARIAEAKSRQVAQRVTGSQPQGGIHH